MKTTSAIIIPFKKERERGSRWSSTGNNDNHFPVKRAEVVHITSLNFLDTRALGVRPYEDFYIENLLTQMFKRKCDNMCGTCWIYQYDPSSKSQSMQWSHKTSPVKEKNQVFPFQGENHEISILGARRADIHRQS
ncbi:hypothetical protein LAZ67_22000758 [Cordylochernes scorpioides]|uniref:Uncharacterized protein n=1 Tax=Cordylochernes scorpioides TaxID=51811 RepID=A0ABY6LQB0_9ARAC|nr:hypothetical protein LAZ67_22000758 [Cordylochernes scorpioides]